VSYVEPAPGLLSCSSVVAYGEVPFAVHRRRGRETLSEVGRRKERCCSSVREADHGGQDPLRETLSVGLGSWSGHQERATCDHRRERVMAGEASFGRRVSRAVGEEHHRDPWESRQGDHGREDQEVRCEEVQFGA
jgi:hypothetical protein